MIVGGRAKGSSAGAGRCRRRRLLLATGVAWRGGRRAPGGAGARRGRRAGAGGGDAGRVGRVRMLVRRRAGDQQRRPGGRAPWAGWLAGGVGDGLAQGAVGQVVALGGDV